MADTCGVNSSGMNQASRQMHEFGWIVINGSALHAANTCLTLASSPGPVLLKLRGVKNCFSPPETLIKTGPGDEASLTHEACFFCDRSLFYDHTRTS